MSACQYSPGLWLSSVENRVDKLPSMALAGASVALEGAFVEVTHPEGLTVPSVNGAEQLTPAAVVAGELELVVVVVPSVVVDEPVVVVDVVANTPISQRE